MFKTHKCYLIVITSEMRGLPSECLHHNICFSAVFFSLLMLFKQKAKAEAQGKNFNVAYLHDEICKKPQMY